MGVFKNLHGMEWDQLMINFHDDMMMGGRQKPGLGPIKMIKDDPDPMGELKPKTSDDGGMDDQ